MELIVTEQVCEDLTRPRFLKTSKPRYLPSPLVAMKASVMDPLNCIDLSLGPRRVLYAILTFVSARSLYKWIYPSRETLAAEAHMGSLQTLYRHLKALEVLGYIERKQMRKEGGCYSLSFIRLTKKAVLLLERKEGDGVGEGGLAGETSFQQERSLIVRDGLYIEERTQQKQLTGSARSLSAAGSSDIDPATRLPADLVFLTAFMRRSQVCYLMKECRLHSKRLSDIVAFHRDYLARCRSPFAFLSTEIKKDVDYAWMLKMKSEEAEKRHEESHVSLSETSLVEALSSSSRAALIKEGKEVAAYSFIDGFFVGERGAIPVNRRLVNDVFAGVVDLRIEMGGSCRLWRPSAQHSCHH